MKTHLLFTALITLVLSQAKAQTLSPEVISTSGAFYVNSTGMLSQTVGELAMVQTFTNSTATLTQGFQQLFDTVTGINELENYHVVVFPNPANDLLYIKVPPGEYSLVIYNSIGQEIFNQTQKVENEVEALPVSYFANGLYHLYINNGKDNFHSKFNLIK